MRGPWTGFPSWPVNVAGVSFADHAGVTVRDHPVVTMDSEKPTNTPPCPICGQPTFRAAGARVLSDQNRAYSLKFRWVCPNCGYEHVDAALRRFNDAQAQCVRLMRSELVRPTEPPAAA